MSTKDKLKPPWSNDPALSNERPRDSATVLLLREARKEPPQVFMVRRHGKSAFMGGLWVFPGGKVDPADSSSAMVSKAGVEASERCRERLMESQELCDSKLALSLHVAAARELFEEAGVLLAEEPIPAVTLHGWRERIESDAHQFSKMLEQEELPLELDRLVYVSRWITPSAEPMRFDTRFFAVKAPADQVPVIDRKETVDGRWRPAADFLKDHENGDLVLAPPTLRHLEELSSHGTLESYLRFVESRAVAPILPKMVMAEGTMLVVLPWDPEYETLGGEGVALGGEPHPFTTTGGPSRFILREGRFFSVSP